MEWRDEGLVIAVRPHGESAAIAQVFTPAHGLHAGVVRGGQSRRLQPALQPGTLVDAVWHARLDDHIGAFTIEPVRSRSAILSDRLALAALNSVTSLLHFALPERDPHPGLYQATNQLLDRCVGLTDWQLAYVEWELLLLEELGYGLDLTSCAVTGTTEGLAFVSPKSGRAVSRAGAGDWADRLLPLPPALLGQGAQEPSNIVKALVTTGHFLSRMAVDLAPNPLPDARQRLVDLLARDA